VGDHAFLGPLLSANKAELRLGKAGEDLPIRIHQLPSAVGTIVYVPAPTVGHKEPGEGGHNAIGAATVGAAGGCTGGHWHESGERRAHRNLPKKRSRLGVDDSRSEWPGSAA
jgi:hypothetical protein